MSILIPDGDGGTLPGCTLYLYTYTYGVDNDIFFYATDDTGVTKGSAIGFDPDLEAMEIGPNDAGILVIKNNGNIGIGTTNPNYKLDVAGDAMANHWYTSSDERLKKNSTPIQDALTKVSALNGVMFEWRTEDYPERELNEGKEIGLIAQEVEEVLPEVVSEDYEGYKSVDYSKLTPLLIEAIKAQQGQIKAQQTQIEALQTRIEILENK